MQLSDQQIEEIAERAARRALTLPYGDPPMTVAEQAAKKVTDSFYVGIGKSVVRKTLWVIGFGALVLLTWLSGKGYLAR